MNAYRSSAELKGMAKEQLFGRYGTVIGAMLLTALSALLSVRVCAGLATLLPASAGIAYFTALYLLSVIVLLFLGILESGSAYLYLKLSCHQPVSASDIFYGFRIYPGKALALQSLVIILALICNAPQQIMAYLYRASHYESIYLLLFAVASIAGYVLLIIVWLMLSQVFYLLQDFPHYSSRELIKTSCRIMRGHKGRLFYITVSFIPLYFLAFLSFGLGLLWITPYKKTVMANFYMDLMCSRPGQTADMAG
ncbi:MAG: DUF975 family protein [Kineothrix sp.]